MVLVQNLGDAWRLLPELRADPEMVNLDDIRHNYGAFYLAMNPTYKYTYFQQQILTPIYEAVTLKDQKFKRTMVTMPFRHSKSEGGTVNLIPFYFGHNPADTVILLCYGKKLARAFGRRIRDMMRSEMYLELFPHAAVAKQSRAADEFTLQAGGRFFASGFDGTINGLGANLCIAEGQRVLTAQGWVPIEHVTVGAEVATPFGWRRVRATRCNGKRSVVRTSFGSHSLLLTANHDILAETGLRQAGSLRRGDRVYGTDLSLVQRDICPKVVSQETPSLLLHQELFRQVLQHVHAQGARKAKAAMRLLQETVCAAYENAQVLFSSVWWDHAAYASAGCLPGVQGNVQPAFFHDLVLFRSLQERGTFGADDGQEKPKLPGRRVGPLLPTALQKAYFASAAQKVQDMLRVWHEGEARCTPHGREQTQRRPRESRRPVPTLSHAISQVEECGVAPVYDLEVEGDHCFCVESIFVGNCVIDDPHKNRQEATSETVIESIHDVYNSVVRTRLEPNASILVNTTRWTPNDFVGWRAQEDGAWDYMRDCEYKDDIGDDDERIASAASAAN